MSRQRIAGICFIFVGIASVYLVTRGRPGTAFLLGESFGYALFPMLIAIGVLALTPLRRRIDTVLIVGIVFGCVTLMKMGSYVLSAREDVRIATEAVEMFEGAVRRNEELSLKFSSMDLDDMGEIRPLSASDLFASNLDVGELFQSYADQSERLHLRYLQAIKVAEISSALTASTLTDIDKASSIRARIVVLREQTTGIQNDSKRLLEAFDDALAARPNDAMAKSSLRGFRTTKQAGLDHIDAFYGLEDKKFQNIDAILEICIANASSITFDDGQLVFSDEEALTRFNRLFEEIAGFTKEEEKLGQRQHDRLRAGVDELKGQL